MADIMLSRPATITAVASPHLDELPGVLPHSSLHARLIALGRSARGSVASLGIFGVVPGIGILSFLLTIPAIIASASSYSNPYMESEGWLIVAVILGLFGGAIGGYFLLRYLVMLRFDGSYSSTLQRLYHSALPLLVVDEDYCAGVIALAKERWTNLFAAPPASRSLNDQLSLAACYINLLSTYQFSMGAERSPLLRHGNSGYFATTPAARVFNAIGSFGGCLPYVGCLGYIVMPLAIRNILRLAEQRGTLCAICAYFSDPRHFNPQTASDNQSSATLPPARPGDVRHFGYDYRLRARDERSDDEPRL